MNKNILVTGGAGYIGSHTVLNLIKNGYNPIIVDNYSNSSPKIIKVLEELSGVNIINYNCDIRNKEDLEKIFDAHNILAVINFAGYKAVGESVRLPLMYYNNNLFGMITLLEVMQEKGVKNIVFSSSATVYGEPDKMPMDETMPTGQTTNPYGSTKLMIEGILKDLAYSDEEWNIVSLRYFNPLGADESGDIGDDPNGIPNNLAPYITQVAIGKLECLSIFGNDYPTKDGTCIRDYIHINDLASGHTASLDFILNNSKIGFEAINLGSGKGYSVIEILNNFEKAVGKEIPHKFVERRLGDIPVSYANIDKAKFMLKWQPKYDINKMCKDAWNWQKKHPDGYK